MAPGFLIALEGVDGAGKTTQARLLAAALRERGWPVVLTREPSDGPTGQKLRDYLAGGGRRLTAGEELALFMEDRREHVARVIRPALEEGRVVVTDRYYYSSAAYQGARGLDPGHIISLNETFAPRPDLLIILTLPSAEGLARRQRAKGEAPQVSEDQTYLEQVAALYDTFAGPHLRRVLARGAPEEVHARMLKLVLKALHGCEKVGRMP